jgi:PAS domain S-box-containing protein
MKVIIIELIYNLSILIAISVLAGFIDNRWKSKTVLGITLQGILFGVATIIGMMNPFVYAPGIIFDGRSVMLSLCGLFFGPFSAIIAATIALIYRLHIGGSGAIMGVSVIISATLIGIVSNYLRKKKELKVSWIFLYSMGLVVHIIMLSLMIWLPSNVRLDTLKTISVTVIGIYPLATILIGKILSDQEEKNNLIKEIIQNEKNTSTTLMSIGDAVIVTDVGGKITRMNKMAEKMTGWTLDEAFGLPLHVVFSIYHLDSHEPQKDPVQQVLESKKVVLLANHTVLINRNGEEFQISDSAAPILDEKGKINGIILVFSNLTDKYLAEKELSRERNLLRTVLDSLPFSLYIKDTNLKKLLANKTELEYANRSEEEVIGKDDFELFPPEQAEIFLKDDLQVIEKGIPIIEKIEFLQLPDNRKRWLSTTKLPWKDEKGKIIGLVGFGFDISDRVEDDKKIRILTETVKQSPTSIIIANIEGTIEYVNPRFEEMTGYIQSDMIGKNARILNDDNTPGSSFDDILATILTGNKWKSEFLSKRKNGETYWESVIVSPIFNNQNEITNIVLIIEDISERKKLITQLVEAKEKAVESDNLKSSFLANMSHEIRTPMNGILGFTELLKDPDLKIDKQHKYLSIIEQSGNRLLNLINDIIDISKIEAGQIKLSIGRSNINKMIDQEYQFFLAEAEKKGLKLLHSKGLPDEKAIIMTDKLRLNQILTNLIKNSLKFTKKGNIEFGYQLKDNFLEFFVSDQGIGISKEIQDQVFERFNQGDIVITRRYEGAGLGLSISKALVEMLGGQIWVQGDEGKGSIFSFTIPYKTV